MLAWLCVWVKVQICILFSDAIATHYLLLQQIQIDFSFMVPAHPVVLDKIQQGCKTVVCMCVLLLLLYKNLLLCNQRPQKITIQTTTTN